MDYENLWNEFQKKTSYVDLDNKGIKLKTIAIDFTKFVENKKGIDKNDT